VTAATPEVTGEQDGSASTAGGCLETRRLPAHRIVLAGVSDFFRTLFESGQWRDSASREVTLSELCPATAVRLLTYAYTGRTSGGDVLPRGDIRTAADVLGAACRYGMHGLVAAAETALVASLNDDCVADVFAAAVELLPQTHRLARAAAHYALLHYSPQFVARTRVGPHFLARVLDYIAANE
jgi:hypothetical protein